MRAHMAMVKNAANLAVAYEALSTSGPNIPRGGLVDGFPGAGKTMATTWLACQTNAVLVRSMSTWTPAAMLDKIMFELGEPAHRSANANLDVIIQCLSQQRRPLFVDEIDMFTNANVRPNRAGQIIETLRSILDMAGMPVLLIGMTGVRTHLRTYPQLTSRLAQIVSFMPADLEDARSLADSVCEVGVEDDLLGHLHGKASGNMRLLSVGLSDIERAAKGAKLDGLGLEQWGERKFQFELTGSVNGSGNGR